MLNRQKYNLNVTTDWITQQASCLDAFSNLFEGIFRRKSYRVKIYDRIQCGNIILLCVFFEFYFVCTHVIFIGVCYYMIFHCWEFLFIFVSTHPHRCVSVLMKWLFVFIKYILSLHWVFFSTPLILICKFRNRFLTIKL